jgi:hypothetical protein
MFIPTFYVWRPSPFTSSGCATTYGDTNLTKHITFIDINTTIWWTGKCLTISFESTSAPWANSKRTMSVLPSWAAMWSGVRSTFVLASRDIPARKSISAVVMWPYWAARCSGLVPSCQQIMYVYILTTTEGHTRITCSLALYILKFTLRSTQISISIS